MWYTGQTNSSSTAASMEQEGPAANGFRVVCKCGQLASRVWVLVNGGRYVICWNGSLPVDILLDLFKDGFIVAERVIAVMP